MKKLVLLGASTLAVASAALLSPAVAAADPVINAQSMNVVGEQYAKAQAILKSQGVRAFFGGSVGGPVPQAACIVSQQKVTKQGRVSLFLDCSQTSLDDAQDAAKPAPAGPAAPAGGAAPGQKTPGQGTYGAPIGVPIPVG